MADENTASDTIELATELTIAWLNNPNNRANADDVPAFLQKMHATLNVLSGSATGSEASSQAEPAYVPAVSVRKSLASPNHIISMIDGKPYKALRRHLSTQGLSPQEYRQRYDLKSDYPMVAPAYSEQRRAMAHKIGLGSKRRKGADAPVEAAPEVKPAKPRRARLKIAPTPK